MIHDFLRRPWHRTEVDNILLLASQILLSQLLSDICLVTYLITYLVSYLVHHQIGRGLIQSIFLGLDSLKCNYEFLSRLKEVLQCYNALEHSGILVLFQAYRRNKDRMNRTPYGIGITK